MGAFEKVVSGGEKLMVALNELRPPFVIQLTLEGQGTPSPDALYEALERTTAVNPGSSLCLDLTGEVDRWVLGPPPPLTIFDAPEFTASSDEDAPFLRWPLSSTTGPTCELVYVRGKHSNYLIFRALHSVMDGQGTLLWVTDFMRCLRGETPVGHASTIDVDQLVNRIKKKSRPLPETNALHPFGRADMDKPGDFHWRRITVPRPLDSVASGSIAVGLAKQARSIADGIVRLNLPTDLRRYCPEERTTGNLFSLLFLDVGPEASPEMIGLKIVHMLYKDVGANSLGTYAADSPGSLAVHRVKVFRDLERMHYSSLYPASATLSHLGILHGVELSAPSWQTTSALFLPLVGDSGCVVSVNGFDERTEAAVGLNDRFMGSGQLDQLAEIVRAALT